MVFVDLSPSAEFPSPCVPQETETVCPDPSPFTIKEGDGAECSPILRRWKANARERRRVQTMRLGFEDLRRAVPVHHAELHLTRMDLLCRAMEYIRYLEREVHDINCCEGLPKPPLLKIVRGAKASTPSTPTGPVPSTLCGSEDRSDEMSAIDIFMMWLESPKEPPDLPCFAVHGCDVDQHNCDFLHSCECTAATSDSSHTKSSSNSDDLPPSVPDLSDAAFEDQESENEKSSPTPPPVFIRRKQRPQRVAINAQLRARSKAMQGAFKQLRSLVPIDPDGPHLTKAKFLQRASRYIAHLRELVEAS